MTWICTTADADISPGAILTSTLIALLSSIDQAGEYNKHGPSERHIADSHLHYLADSAAAIGVTYLFRATGSVLGIAISTSILQQSLKSNLTKYFSGEHADNIIGKIRQNVDYIKELQGNERAAAIASYWAAMHNVFLAIMIAAILAVSVYTSLIWVVYGWSAALTMPRCSLLLCCSFNSTTFQVRWTRKNKPQ